MDIKDVNIKKGMNKDEVNNLISEWIKLEDDKYMGNAYKHNWKCKCGNIIENRMWTNIRKRNSLECNKCRIKRITSKHKLDVSDINGYEYIKSYIKGDRLCNGEVANSPHIRIKHNYCGCEYEISVANWRRGARCTSCCGTYDNSFAYHIEQELGEPLEKYWDFDKNTVNPYHIWRNSSIKTIGKVWIKCTGGNDLHTYDVATYSFVKGHRCKRCVNKGINIISSFAQYHIDNTDPDFLEKYWDYDKNTLNP